MEAILVFFLIMGQIWLWPEYPWLVAVPILIALISWFLRDDRQKNLGLTYFAMIFCFLYFLSLIFAVGLIWKKDYLLGAISEKTFWLKFGEKSLRYYPWALFQQLVMNVFFVSRLITVFNGNIKKTIWVTAALFAVIHLPNPILTAVTFIGSVMSIYFFLRTRNIYILAMAHAVLAVAVRFFLDYSLRIGPGFLKIHPLF